MATTAIQTDTLSVHVQPQTAQVQAQAQVQVRGVRDLNLEQHSQLNSPSHNSNMVVPQHIQVKQGLKIPDHDNNDDNKNDANLNSNSVTKFYPSTSISTNTPSSSTTAASKSPGRYRNRDGDGDGNGHVYKYKPSSTPRTVSQTTFTTLSASSREPSGATSASNEQFQLDTDSRCNSFVMSMEEHNIGNGSGNCPGPGPFQPQLRSSLEANLCGKLNRIQAQASTSPNCSSFTGECAYEDEDENKINRVLDNGDIANEHDRLNLQQHNFQDLDSDLSFDSRSRSSITTSTPLTPLTPHNVRSMSKAISISTHANVLLHQAPASLLVPPSIPSITTQINVKNPGDRNPLGADTPMYVSSELTQVISPIDYPRMNTRTNIGLSVAPEHGVGTHAGTELDLNDNAKANTNPPTQSKHKKSHGKLWQCRRVQPVVYSAIGSLECANPSNFGSFNDKFESIAMAKKLRQKKKQKAAGMGIIRVDSHLVDVNSNTSQINARTMIIANTKTSTKIKDQGVNVGKGIGIGKTLGVGSNGNVDAQKVIVLPPMKSIPVKNDETRPQKMREESSSVSSREVTNKNMLEVPTRISSATAPDTKNKIRDNESQEKSTGLNTKYRHHSASQLEGLNPTDINFQKSKRKGKKKKKVQIDSKPKEIKHVELFRPSCDAYTPRMGRKEIKYKPAEQRLNSMEGTSHNAMGTISKPNFKDALRRVAMIIQQHILKIEERFQSGADHLDLFEPSMRDAFAEENFVTPRYKCTTVNIPMARGGVMYGMRKIRLETKIPTADDIYEFGHRLFKQVQLSSECSIICLIYVERIMEASKVPVMAKTWKPIFMCGLLLASKVWQDWSSWNIEFANVYPQFSLESINKLEIQFLKMVKWDLYISSSLYAKYYFALRSLLEKQDFRRRYVRMVGGVGNVPASQAMKISKRTEILKESLECISRSV